MENFLSELEQLINKYSLENGSNTPDFILSTYLRQCLSVWDTCVTLRDQWYGPTKVENINTSEWTKAVDEAPQGPIIPRD